MNPANNTMAKLFQTEITKLEVKGHSPFKQDEAEFLRDASTARKRSLLPIGISYIILYILNGNMLFKHKIFVFQSLMMKMMMMMMIMTTKMTKITMIKKGEERRRDKVFV